MNDEQKDNENEDVFNKHIGDSTDPFLEAARDYERAEYNLGVISSLVTSYYHRLSSEGLPPPLVNLLVANYSSLLTSQGYR